MQNETANIYAFSRHQVLQEFAAYVSGDQSGLFIAVCAQPLSETARNALVKSAEALGYGSAGVTFIRSDAAEPALGAARLKRLIEGIDPFCFVCADATATKLARDAYACNLPDTGTARVMGREVRTFANLGALMDTPAHKQQAWALLKTLPKR